jgi:hypothetical protein
MGKKTKNNGKKYFLCQSEPSQSFCIILQLITVEGLNIFCTISRMFIILKLRPTGHEKNKTNIHKYD